MIIIRYNEIIERFLSGTGVCEKGQISLVATFTLVWAGCIRSYGPYYFDWSMAAMIRSTLFRNISPHTRILDGKYVQLHFSHVGRSKFTSTKSLYQESMAADGDTATKHTNSTGDQQHSLDLSFCNSKEAYRSKTTAEIARGLFVFNMCSIPFLVNHNKTVRARCYINFCRCCAL